MTHLLNVAAFLNLLDKSKPAKLTSFYRRAPNAASGLYLCCQDDLPNTFAWVMSIHPYIHPVNGSGGSFSTCVSGPFSSQPIFIMSLRTGPNDWQELLTKIGIPADSARTYAKTFVEESIIKDSLTMIDREVLKQLGVMTMGLALAILKPAKEQPLTSDSYTKAPVSQTSPSPFRDDISTIPKV